MYDILLKGGTVLDGTGRAPFVGDVGIRGGNIVALDSRIDQPAEQIIEVQGKYVCPGFVDAHSHDDLAILHDVMLPNKVLQGVTTTIVGNCGFGVAPVTPQTRQAVRPYAEPILGRWSDSEADFGFPSTSEYVKAIRDTNHGLNVGVLIPHGPLRIRVMGSATRAATDAEIVEMQQLLADEMSSGGLGLSFGLQYAPGCFADKQEIFALGAVVRDHDGVVTVHMRGYGGLLLPSLREMIELAEVVRVPVHISHLIYEGLRNQGGIRHALQMIEEARGRGIGVTCDTYPYTAGSSTVLVLLPPWALKGTVSDILNRVQDEKIRSDIIKDLEGPGSDWDNIAYVSGFDHVVLTSAASPATKAYEGWTFDQIARDMGCGDIEAYLRVVSKSGGQDTIIVHILDENDVRQVIRSPYAAIGSDGLPSPDRQPHPRLYGAFPRYLSKYVRQERLLNLEEAVRKITSFPMQIFRIEGRGVIAPGYRADVVVLDMEHLADLATYDAPRQYARGIEHVIVNGQIVVNKGELTANTPGTIV